MMKRFPQLLVLVFGLAAAVDAMAAGSIIVAAVMGASWVAANAVLATVVAFAINMVVSTVITKALFSPNQPDMSGGASNAPNPGNRQQIPPATDSKLPVVYGDAWVGGNIIDLSITSNNQDIYYIIALSEVTGGEHGTPDVFTFGDIYYGGKKVIFQADGHTVSGLLDESTGETNSQVNGKIQIFLYSNGSFSPTNSSQTAIQVMQTAGLTYTWNSTKAMSNCAFMIVHLTYNAEAGIRGIEQTKVRVRNARYSPGDCFFDYMVSERYGAAIPQSQIDYASLAALNTYCQENFTYTNYQGFVSTQTRFRFDGTIDTQRTIMQNLQDMAACCDCLLKYNEMTAKWGVIVQKPTYTVAMALDDSNIVSAIQITPLDIANSFNVAEVKFPDKKNQDSFNSATFDLAEVDPALLYPNEPVNKQSMALPLVNDDVRAQYLANRFLKSAREDLQVDCSINFVGIQLEAGDIVTLTNANYGWVAKLFRINRVVETFQDDGSVICKLLLMEFNPTVYDDVSITEFQPAPNTGIGSPSTFGSFIAPQVVGQFSNAPDPYLTVQITSSSNGIVQYAELWYSAYANPTPEQRLFAGTTAIQSNGNPYDPSTLLPLVNVYIPSGNWYFFSRMVNSLGTSDFSTASTLVTWRPSTYQYYDRYLNVMYATNATGTAGFSSDPRNKTYYGLSNTPVATPSTNPADYTWYAGSFGTDNFLLFSNRNNRKFSFGVGNAGYQNLGGAFVPSETSVYDSSTWSALPDGINSIDLDARTGQLIKAGTTTVSSADGLLSINNNTQGGMVVSLEKFLNFGNGVYSKTVSVATLTVDVYGRVVGFTQPDNFYYTENTFTATASQTVFSVPHIVGQCLVFRNGELLVPTSDYTENSTTVTMVTACSAGEKIVVVEMRAVSTDIYFEILNTTIASSTSTTITMTAATPQIINAGDLLCFASTQPSPTDTPTTFTVQSVNTSTKVITFTGTISGATAGLNVYRKRAAGSDYAPFSRYEVDLTNVSSYTPSTFQILNGFEQIYINGVQFTEVDYDLSDTTITGLPSTLTGKMSILLFAPNNFNVPASNITNTVAYSVGSATFYSFPNNPLSMAVYANGSRLVAGASNDFSAASSGYTLTTAFPNSFTILNQQTFARIGDA